MDSGLTISIGKIISVAHYVTWDCELAHPHKLRARYGPLLAPMIR
jgi:hypothetical protein